MPQRMTGSVASLPRTKRVPRRRVQLSVRIRCTKVDPAADKAWTEFLIRLLREKTQEKQTVRTM